MPRRNLYLLVAGLVALTACARPHSEAFTTQTPTVPTLATTMPAGVVEPPPPIIFGGAGFTVHATGRVDQQAFDASWAAVLDMLNRYLEAAVLTPLRSGGPAGDLVPFFTPPSVAKVTSPGPDRAAFIDEGLAPVAELRRVRAVATLTALAEPDAVMSLVSAELDLRLTGLVNGAPLTLVRTGELVLLLDRGAWRIDAWDLKVTRTLARVTTTTAAKT
jgi:hypothetical protein